MDTLVLDACCVLNLYATGKIAEVLRALPYDFAIVEIVSQEALFVRAEGGDPAQPRETVELDPLRVEGLLATLTIGSSEEESAFVEYASDIDDGEAMTCALAVSRGHGVATDDLKVIRLAKRGAMGAPIVSTAQLMKAWADVASVDAATLRDTLRAIEARASFTPRKDDALRGWWSDVCRRS